MREEGMTKMTHLPAHVSRPAQVLIPLMPGSDHASLLKLARWLAPEIPVLLVGIVPISEGENLSAGAGYARDLRALINRHVDRINLRAKSRIRVTFTPWEEMHIILAEDPTINLLVLEGVVKTR